MKTSYFAKAGRDPLGVAISMSVPREFKGVRVYSALTPTPDMLKEYKATGDWERYEARYRNEILSKVGPEQVVAECGNDAILLCWEGSDKNCHRRIVAAWLEDQLGIEVPEL